MTITIVQYNKLLDFNEYVFIIYFSLLYTTLQSDNLAATKDYNMLQIHENSHKNNIKKEYQCKDII